MERVICLVMGYVFGLFQTGYLYSRGHHIDIRNYGSGNSGSTNILRVMGVKAGLIVFLGDAFKMIFATLVTRYLFRDQPDVLYLYLLYTGLGVVLGHNYPFYMGFRGGKGIASCAGLMAALDWRVTLVCFIVFSSVVYVTRYVSLGSILVMALMFAGFVFFGTVCGDYGLAAVHIPEFILVAAVISVLGVWRHHTNIRRLLSGTENKIGAKKKE